DQSLRPALKAKEQQVRRAALVALDQMGAQLDPQVVLTSLESPDVALRDSARWIAGHHAEWGDKLTQYLSRLTTKPMAQAEETQLVELLAKLAQSKAVQQFLAEMCGAAARSPASAHL